MTWSNRPGQENELRFKEIEDNFGIQNIKDISFDATTGILRIFTETKKFKVTLTEEV